MHVDPIGWKSQELCDVVTYGKWPMRGDVNICVMVPNVRDRRARTDRCVRNVRHMVAGPDWAGAREYLFDALIAPKDNVDRWHRSRPKIGLPFDGECADRGQSLLVSLRNHSDGVSVPDNGNDAWHSTGGGVVHRYES
jgi:hypothetical protein